jgi:hypothetical protein
MLNMRFTSKTCVDVVILLNITVHGTNKQRLTFPNTTPALDWRRAKRRQGERLRALVALAVRAKWGRRRRTDAV